MTKSFQELDYQQTSLGELVLRKRSSPSLDGQPVFEVKLNGEFLMSSVVTHSEEALAALALKAWGDQQCDVLIGGLGLGYTAAAALRCASIRHLEVVEFLEPVIQWHRQRLVPAADILLDDPRCELIHDDFFKYVADPAGKPDRRYDLILVDIDHSPESWLHASNKAFYSSDGLKRLAQHLRPGGVFGLWSTGKPRQEFLERLGSHFSTVKEHTISYHHPMLHQEENDTIIIAR